MRSQSARDCVALLARRHFWGPSGSIPELCHEMDSLRPAVSKLQGKTERADSLPVPWSLFSSCSLSSALPSPSCFCEGPERPTSIQHFGPRYEYTFSVATVLRDTLDAPRSFVRPTPLFPFPSISTSTFFLLPLLLLLHFLPRWISANISSWHAQVVMCKKDEFYCGTRGDH